MGIKQKWNEVGSFLKSNKGQSAALVGSLLTGNVPAAVAAGISLVSSATGTDQPEEAIKILSNDPAAMIRLKELELENEKLIRQHIETMKELELRDEQHMHLTTQETIRSGDHAEDAFVRRTRPAQSWVSLLAALAYVFVMENVDLYVLMALLTLPWTYAGLRQIGKGVDVIGNIKTAGIKTSK